MIKQIIKRDGSIEDFTPNKVNGWGEWAAKTLGGNVDWSAVVIQAVNQCPEVCTSHQLQKTLIEVCIGMNTWEYNRMAGRLYADLIEREMYDGNRPTIKEVHTRLFEAGIMVKLNYTDEEYAQAEEIIDHKRNLKYPHFQLNQIRKKYALRNKVDGKEYESAQFVYMRMAMALAEDEKSDRMLHVKEWYELFSQNVINPPTPNFVNLGTPLRGYASCCVYTSGDSWGSLAAGDHIAYAMTCMSAGIGSQITTRSLGDPVRGGVIEHQGKVPYLRALAGAVQANLQNGRGGAVTSHYSAYDPEVEVLQKLRHPNTPIAKAVRGSHYSFGSNKFFARKAARNEDVALFSYYHAKDLYEAQFAKDQSLFEKLYDEFLKSDKPRRMANARDVVLGALTQAYETGVHYQHQTDAMNKHTPFKEPIRSSNLCQEIFEPTKPYKSVADLYNPVYDEENHGEIALCNLAGIIVSNVEDDEHYAKACYYALRMIYKTIHMTEYAFPNLEYTAKARMNAGVSVLGLAHLMAKKNQKYSTQEGRDFIHELFETHYWHLLNASLKLSEEFGNAPWMHKTLWPEGWLPIDTYCKKVDELVTVENKRDWEGIRKRIIANKGHAFSVLCAHVPGESSTIAAGTTNGMYPIRELNIMKTNETLVNYWSAPDGTKYKNRYELAWDIPTKNLIWDYAIAQKWTDQGISADLYQRILKGEKVTSTKVLEDYLEIVKYEIKSRYYVNSLTSGGVDLEGTEGAIEEQQTEAVEVGCAGGACTL